MKSFAKQLMKNSVILRFFPHLFSVLCCPRKSSRFSFLCGRWDCLKGEVVFHRAVKWHRDGSEGTKSEQSPHLASLCKQLMGMLLHWLGNMIFTLVTSPSAEGESILFLHLLNWKRDHSFQTSKSTQVLVVWNIFPN